MTDIRDALRRASGVSETDGVNHGRIQEKAGQIVRRRRITYSAVTVMAVLVVGFSTFQVAQGNWFGSKSAKDVVTQPEGVDAVLSVKPAAPTEGEEITVSLENRSETSLTSSSEYLLERKDNGRWMGIAAVSATEDTSVEPGSTKIVAALGSLEAGTYRVTKNLGSEQISLKFTVEPSPPVEPIRIATPTDGEAVTSPVTVSGTANVYEGTVSIRVLGEDGSVLTETFTTATCGSGCEGDFSKDVAFEVQTEQFGTIEVYSESAETGEPMFRQSVVVTLVPNETTAEEETSTPSDEGERAAIEVETPVPGNNLLSPSVLVEGTANTFEANVRIQILDESGEVIADTFTTATCGSGCRGDFSKRVKFSVDEMQDGTLLVFESSAENGEPINLVEIPVTLLPD